MFLLSIHTAEAKSLCTTYSLRRLSFSSIGAVSDIRTSSIAIVAKMELYLLSSNSTIFAVRSAITLTESFSVVFIVNTAMKTEMMMETIPNKRIMVRVFFLMIWLMDLSC